MNAPAPNHAQVLDDALREKIIDALRSIYDPEIPVNIYDLGLIYTIEQSGFGEISIKMTLTAPACPVAGSMPGVVADRVKALAEVDECQVELVWDPPWTKDLITDEVKLELGIL
jgi:FeS assembly SUF system protein